MGDNLKKKMLDALTWATIDRFGQQGVQFIVGLIFARLISPDDYGLVGMLMIFVALSGTFVDAGFSQALIRKPNVDETDLNTVFYFNIFISIALYIILFFFAPALSSFFNQPQLISISRVMFLGILFNSFYLIPVVKMVRKLDFKTGAIINITSVFCSAFTGVLLAFRGFGVWALVAQMVSFQFFRMLIIISYVRWKPKLIFSFNVIRQSWAFSFNLLGTGILNVIFNYLYILILGKFYPKHDVGYYSQANKLNETTNFSFQTILVGSTYSLLVKIQNDDDRFRRIFREIAQKTSIITFPIMLTLIACAKPLIVVLLTNKWIASVPYFQLLCLATLFGPLYTLNINALNARGKSRVTFKLEFIKKLMILFSLLICFHLGIIAMLWGYVFACFAAYLISILYLKKDLNHYIKHQINDFIKCFSFGSMIALCAFGISFFIQNFYFLLGSQIILSNLIYFFIIKLFFNNLYTNALQFVGGKFQKLIKK